MSNVTCLTKIIIYEKYQKKITRKIQTTVYMIKRSYYGEINELIGMRYDNNYNTNRYYDIRYDLLSKIFETFIKMSIL